MPLPWIIGGAVLWAGKKIYDNYQESEEDDRQRRNREYEREEKAERAQEKAKTLERATRKEEIVANALSELSTLFNNHSDVITSKSSLFGSGHQIDSDQMFSALKKISQNGINGSFTEESMLTYLRQMVPDAQISVKQQRDNHECLTSQREIDELNQFINQLSTRR